MNLTAGVLPINKVPHYDMSDNPTGCCPRFNPEGWDDQEIVFQDKLFVEATTRSILHIPLNMGRVFGSTFGAIEAANASDPTQCIVLSKEISPWKAAHFFAVTKEVPGRKMVRLTGRYHTKVFEGPYSNARKWCEELTKIGSANWNKVPETFFFYTTCPKCAKHYGKNFVVGLVAV